MNTLLDTILLATDASEDAGQAARVAADLGKKTGAELHVVHAWQTVPSPHFEGWINSALEQESRELLDGQVKKIRDSGGELSGSHSKKNPPVQAILELAAGIDSDLIVMGSRGVGRLKRLATGSVSEGVVHNASVPVLVVRGGEDAWPPKHVIVGEDGSGPAREAGDLAAEIGALTGAGMTLLRVYPELPEMYEEGHRMNPRLTDDGLRQAEKELGYRAAELENSLGRKPRISISMGDAAEDLIGAAEKRGGKNALIAVGSRGLEPIQRFRTGSVSTKVLRAAVGPVLISPAHP